MASMNRGKWSQPGVPHKGWQFVGFDDLEEIAETCEMCETQSIRYVHYMEHPGYPDVLGAGRDCAEHMSGDYVGPKRREREARSLADRRRRWMNGQWNYSKNGNPYVNRHGFHIVVYKRARRWTFKITWRETGEFTHGNAYDSFEQAKLESFERFETLRK